jgi:Helix-turn-helix domain
MTQTQTARILRALRSGPVSCTDFQAPTCDGGFPVLRVAARIADLKDAGYGIDSRLARNGTAIYTLTLDVGRDINEQPGQRAPDRPGTDASVDVPPDAGGLFDAGVFVARGDYRDTEAA